MGEHGSTAVRSPGTPLVKGWWAGAKCATNQGALPPNPTLGPKWLRYMLIRSTRLVHPVCAHGWLYFKTPSRCDTLLKSSLPPPLLLHDRAVLPRTFLIEYGGARIHSSEVARDPTTNATASPPRQERGEEPSAAVCAGTPTCSCRMRPANEEEPPETPSTRAASKNPAGSGRQPDCWLLERGRTTHARLAWKTAARLLKSAQRSGAPASSR